MGENNRLAGRLNEYELDMIQAPGRQKSCGGSVFYGKRVLICGAGNTDLARSIALSFLYLNEKKHAGEKVRVLAAQMGDARFEQLAAVREDLQLVSGAERLQADYVIVPGWCCTPYPPAAAEEQLRSRLAGVDTAGTALFLSDHRVFQNRKAGVAYSENEAKRDNPAALLEQAFMDAAAGWGCRTVILRTGRLYGPCTEGLLSHELEQMSAAAASASRTEFAFNGMAASYLAVHDLLSAIWLLLSDERAKGIYHAAGESAASGDLAALLMRNFPKTCRIDLVCREENQKETPILLNTQKLRLLGWQPRLSLEDGIIIQTKQKSGSADIFVFDDTYQGKLTTVQQILLAYLKEVDRICKAHGIRYFLAGGTLLGAVRHHGFIPWDDDADVMMLREDYDRFLEIAKTELPENIFLQLPDTDPGTHFPFAKLRLDDTIFATKFSIKFPEQHNGVFFDVLAHDRTGKGRLSQKLHIWGTMLARAMVLSKWEKQPVKGGGAHPGILKAADLLNHICPLKLSERLLHRLLRWYQHRETGFLYDGMGRNISHGAFPEAWLAEAVEMEFEGYRFPVPREYDKYLRYLYGDYEQMIPVSERRTSHTIEWLDLGEYVDFGPEDSLACSAAPGEEQSSK